MGLTGNRNRQFLPVYSVVAACATSLLDIALCHGIRTPFPSRCVHGALANNGRKVVATKFRALLGSNADGRQATAGRTGDSGQGAAGGDASGNRESHRTVKGWSPCSAVACPGPCAMRLPTGKTPAMLQVGRRCQRLGGRDSPHGRTDFPLPNPPTLRASGGSCVLAGACIASRAPRGEGATDAVRVCGAARLVPHAVSAFAMGRDGVPIHGTGGVHQTRPCALKRLTLRGR